MRLRTITGSVAAFAAVITVFTAVVGAVTLRDYKQRAGSAREVVARLIENAGERPPARDIEKLAGLLRPSEVIEWPSGSVETDNAWLALELDRIEAEPSGTKRLAILTGIDERLAAIVRAVEDIETAEVGTRSKDEDKQKLAEILRREEYQKAQQKEESLFQKWWREFTEWLARQFPQPDIPSEPSAGMGSLTYALQIIVLLVVVAIVGFLIYKFAPALARRIGLRNKEKRDPRVILGERIEAHESGHDLLAEAERLAREGDLRGAIRKGYIAVLCDLSDRNVIALARHKTNRDYLRDVRRNERLFDRMHGLTGTFERRWYGLTPARGEEWESFRNACRQTVTETGR
ncbi:MAG: DUF4129 domain-containing protein [Chloracidobacterium sp.]|nr:DUF4129 domain-containing protein [Chloracidobacterium sp.]